MQLGFGPSQQQPDAMTEQLIGLRRPALFFENLVHRVGAHSAAE